ncbi:MAG: NAD(P)H-dependent oxidoreductase [Pseudomonadota bacterium]
MAQTILRIDASARKEGSVTRDLTEKVTARLGAERVITRDLTDGIDLLDEGWLAANWTAPEERSAAQKAALAGSDTLIEELMAADTLVIGAPIYNFGVPAALKAWIDQVARAGITFKYTDTGPQGLLEGKRAIIVTASGGTKVGSEIDFATGYLKFALGFIGITEVEIVAADQMALDAEASLKSANDRVEALAA